MNPRFSTPLRRALMSLCGASLAFAGTAGASSAKIELIPRDAITLDGKLTEPLYAEGDWNTDFTVVRSSDKAANQTAFRLFTDGEKLYFSARMHKNGGKFLNGGKVRDSVPLHGGDHINLFIRATDDPSEYLQFLVTSQGVISDIRLTQSGVTKDYSWNTDIVAASHVDEKAETWTIEMSVPLASLNIDPAMKVWHANVGRLTVKQPAKDGGPREFNSWIPSPTEIENANSLVPIGLPDFDRMIFGWNVRHSPIRVILKDGKSYLATTATVTNQTGAPRTATLRSSIDGIAGAQSDQSLTLAPGETKEIATLTPLEQRREGKGLFRLSIIQNEKGRGEQLLALATEQIDVAYASAVLKLTDPGYRATIFASQNLKTLRAELIRWDTYATIGDVKAALIAEDGTRIPAAVTEAEADSLWKITADGIDQLADGNYRLEVTYSLDQEGSTSADGAQTLTRDIRKVPYQAGEMWIDEKGIVYRDGKPFPSYGFHYGRRDTTAKVQGLIPGMFYNTYLPIWVKPPFTTAAATESVSNLAAINILSAVNVLHSVKDAARKNPSDELTKEERDGFRNLALALRDNPNVIGYYLADEPEYRGMSPRRLQRIYEILRDADPYHPVIITNNTDEAVRNYQLCSDIHNPDPYPLFLAGGGPARHFTRISSHISNVQIGEESYRALWITPQGFDLQPFRPGETGHRGPNATEMRAQQMISLIHRAVGVTWYTEEYAWEEPGITSSLAYLSQEYVWLFPHLVAARPRVLDTPATVTAALSATDKGGVLMITNLERAVTEVTLTDPQLKELKTWRRIDGEGTPLEGGTESLALKLDPHESLVLVSDGLSLPEKLATWNSVLAEEKRLAAAVDRSPENIALGVNGSTVKAIGGGWNAFLSTNGVKETRSSAFYQPHFKAGKGLEITFPKTKKPQRVVVSSSNILKGAVEVSSSLEGNKWVEVARIDNATPYQENTLTFEATPARRLRVIAETVSPIQGNALHIIHVSVYEK